MICGGHVCALHLATAGLQGSGLGSDEEEVIVLVYIVIDVVSNKVVGEQQYSVRGTRGEAATIESTPGSIPLDAAIAHFDCYVRSLQIDPNSPLFRLVTDGQPPLRQCIHPETCSKGIPLPSYYSRFHDLRKEFVRAYTLRAVAPPATAHEPPPPPPESPNGIEDMLQYLGMTQYEGDDYFSKEAKDMANIIQRILSDGFRLELPETIDIVLETGICSKDDEIDGNCIVRARGLPWQSSDQDIAKFFRGLNVVKGGVALCLSPQGRRNGEALVRFVSQEHRDMALKRHKHHIGTRYIEVYRASGEDFLRVAGGATSEAAAFLSRGAQVIVRMRGLPYDATHQQVLEFFNLGEDPVEVVDGAEGVLFVRRADGRATGDAFVLFASEDDAPRALARHRRLIGSRYIELFRSTTAEVQQVLNRSLEPRTTASVGDGLERALLAGVGGVVGGVPAGVPPAPLVPQHVITSGTLKDCVRLRGLPYEAQVEHILNFLDDFAKNIVFQGVHMVYNAQGQPSGEAFIQMDSEASAFLCAQQKHHRFMTFGKKQRYIEVFQCSGDDMNLVLTGGIASPVSPGASKVGAVGTLLPSPPLATTTLPPSFTTLPPPALPPQSPHSRLLAAQQAQLIAHHNLIARQQDQQALFASQFAQQQFAAQYASLAAMAPPTHTVAQQQYYSFLTPHASQTYAAMAQMGAATSVKQHMLNQSSLFTQQPYFLYATPPRLQLPSSSMSRLQIPTSMSSQLASYQPTASYLPQTFLPPTVKRSYEQAFTSVSAADVAAAKRQFPGLSAAISSSASSVVSTMPSMSTVPVLQPPVAYQPYYPGI